MSNSRGYKFEKRVDAILSKLKRSFPRYVGIKRQLKLKLYNGDEVIPDFELSVNLGHHIETQLIECQSRKRSSPEIQRKIRDMKSLSSRNRFLFVYEDESFLSVAHRRSLESDGVNIYSIDHFEEYINALAEVLTRIYSKDKFLGGHSDFFKEHDIQSH